MTTDRPEGPSADPSAAADPAAQPEPLLEGATSAAGPPLGPDVHATTDASAASEPDLGLRSVLGEAYRRFAADWLRLVAISCGTTIVAFLLPTTGSSTWLNVIASVLLMDAAAVGARSPMNPGKRFGRRLGWVFVRNLVLLALVAPVGILAIAWSVAGGSDSAIATAAFVAALAIWVVWVGVRLSMADAAIILGDLRVNAAVAESLRLTRPGRQAWRVGLVLAIAHLVSFPALGLVVFGPLASLPEAVATVVLGAVLGAVLAPLPVVTVVLYRRLGGLEAPFQPAWLPDPGLARLARPAAFVAGAQVVASVVGALALGPYLLGYIGAGRFAPPDAVPAGQIWFGSGEDIEACRVTGRAETFEVDAAIFYVASLADSIGAADDVVLEVRLDGELIASPDQPGLDGADCFTNTDAMRDLPAGTYQFSVVVNGHREAGGKFVVGPP